MGTNVNLAQAIAAARAGKTAQARILVDRILQDEPENANAWFLLSTIAETEEEQIASLERVLEIDPNHEAASARMGQLSESAEPVDTTAYAETIEEAPESVTEEIEEAFDEMAEMEEEAIITPAPPIVSDESRDFIAQSDGETVPAWMADEGEGVLEAMPPAPVEEEPAEPAELPDWLQEEPGDEWLGEEETAVAQGEWQPGDEVPAAVEAPVEEAREAAKKPEPAARPRAKTTKDDQSNLLLVVLIALAVIVALVLVYVLVAQPL